MTILYQVTKDERFDSKVEWFLDINLDRNEVEWICYPHALAGMHPRHADSKWMGSKHHNGVQSFIDFGRKPKYELKEVTLKVLQAIADSYENDEENVKKIRSFVGASKLDFTRVGKHIYPWYRCVCDDVELFRIDSVIEIEITRLDLLALVFSRY